MKRIILITILFIFLFIYPVNAQFSMILNFDDGYLRVYKNAFPLMEQYQIPGVAFVVTKYINSVRHMQKSHLIQLKNAGWEIGSHTVRHPNLTLLTDNGIKDELIDSKKDLKDYKLINSNYSSLATPYNKWNKNISEIAPGYYNIIRSDKIYYGYNNTEIPSEELVILKNTPLTTIKSRISKAQKSNQLLLLIFHEIGLGPNNFYYATEKFNKLIKYLHTNYQQNISTYQSYLDSYIKTPK